MYQDIYYQLRFKAFLISQVEKSKGKIMKESKLAKPLFIGFSEYRRGRK